MNVPQCELDSIADRSVMQSPFPGMDPYLEDPQFWPGVHNRAIVYLADQLLP